MLQLSVVYQYTQRRNKKNMGQVCEFVLNLFTHPIVHAQKPKVHNLFFPEA